MSTKVIFEKEGVQHTGYQVWRDDTNKELAVEMPDGTVEEVCFTMVKEIVRED